ncbi:MAG: glycosyltransferase [Gammaproteobacteria bacterium]|nr:glycosyltransferase [Gammaproteobacteria bacterium]
MPDAYRLLKAFDAFVLSSGPLEAFGVVLLEAMLARLPIVSSTAPGPVEVVGDSALTFAVGDDGALTPTSPGFAAWEQPSGTRWASVVTGDTLMPLRPRSSPGDCGPWNPSAGFWIPRDNIFCDEIVAMKVPEFDRRRS